MFFIATANMADTIPGPLLDRMEVIRFDGYTTDEKVAIARGTCGRASVERTGLRDDEVTIADDVLRDDGHRVHARGGRAQARARARRPSLRKTATRDRSGEAQPPVVIDARAGARRTRAQEVLAGGAERTAMPGVATGLAVTGSGGDVLFVEATVDAGRERRPRADRPARRRDEGVGADRADATCARTRTSSASTATRSTERTFHVHVPAGAIPKDGPSAGITMSTALVSLLTGRPVGTRSA